MGIRGKGRCGTFVTYLYHVQEGIPARYISLYTKYEVQRNPSDFPCIFCTALADDRVGIITQFWDRVLFASSAKSTDKGLCHRERTFCWD